MSLFCLQFIDNILNINMDDKNISHYKKVVLTMLTLPANAVDWGSSLY